MKRTECHAAWSCCSPRRKLRACKVGHQWQMFHEILPLDPLVKLNPPNSCWNPHAQRLNPHGLMVNPRPFSAHGRAESKADAARAWTIAGTGTWDQFEAGGLLQQTVPLTCESTEASISRGSNCQVQEPNPVPIIPDLWLPKLASFLARFEL